MTEADSEPATFEIEQRIIEVFREQASAAQTLLSYLHQAIPKEI